MDIIPPPASEPTEPLPTIWHVPDDLWIVFSALIAEHDPPRRTGRKRMDPRKALDGIIYRARTGCQWNHLPAAFGDDSSVHRTFVRWNGWGLYDKLRALLLASCAELGGVDWQWQAADEARRSGADGWWRERWPGCQGGVAF